MLSVYQTGLEKTWRGQAPKVLCLRNLILQDDHIYKQFLTNNLHASLAGVPPL